MYTFMNTRNDNYYITLSLAQKSFFTQTKINEKYVHANISLLTRSFGVCVAYLILGFLQI